MKSIIIKSLKKNSMKKTERNEEERMVKTKVEAYNTNDHALKTGELMKDIILRNYDSSMLKEERNGQKVEGYDGSYWKTNGWYSSKPGNERGEEWHY